MPVLAFFFEIGRMGKIEFWNVPAQTVRPASADFSPDEGRQ